MGLRQHLSNIAIVLGVFFAGTTVSCGPAVLNNDEITSEGQQAAPNILQTQKRSQAQALRADEAWGSYFKYYSGNTDYLQDVLSGVVVLNPGEENHPPHQHSEEEFLMVVEGNGTWTINQDVSPALAGDLLFAQAGDLHGLRNTGSTPLRFVFIKYNQKLKSK